MTMLRIVGLMSVALLTMGSGGIKKSNGGDTSATTTPQQIETLTPEDKALTDVPTDANAMAVQPAASGTPAPRPAVSQANAAIVSGADRAIELAVSDSYLQARYYTGGGLLGVDQARGHAGFYFSDDRDLIGNVGLMTVPTPLFVDGLSLSAGARGFLALLSTPNEDVFGLAPGVEARYVLPYSHPMAVVGNIFYAPNILTLGDAKNILDLDVRYEVQVVPNAVGFVGYREFRFDSDQGDDTRAANGIHVGGRFSF
jgi:hypothetical protein